MLSKLIRIRPNTVSKTEDTVIMSKAKQFFIPQVKVQLRTGKEELHIAAMFLGDREDTLKHKHMSSFLEQLNNIIWA